MNSAHPRRAQARRRPLPHARGPACPGPVTTILGVVLLVLPVLAPPARAGAQPDAAAMLARAARAGREIPHHGQLLWVTWDDRGASAVTVDVEQRDGDLTVRTPGQSTVELSDVGGGVVDHEGGWFLPLPRPRGVPFQPARQLDDKYTVTVGGTERLLDRPTTRVEVRRRSDGLLRERLWVDDATGLLLRRETRAGEQLLRMAVYVSLDLSPPPAEPAVAHADGDTVPLRTLDQGVEPVGPDGLDALRRAGWIVPHELPGGYAPDGGFVVAAPGMQPLQLVYDDGLYTVSLFAQPGSLDPATLPEGATPARWPSLPPDAEVYEWPGAVPQRLVWEAAGTTYSLIGDSPPEEFRAIASALPHDVPDGPWRRVKTGLSRLWSWVSPWS